jgi:hypothetical protein
MLASRGRRTARNAGDAGVVSVLVREGERISRKRKGEGFAWPLVGAPAAAARSAGSPGCRRQGFPWSHGPPEQKVNDEWLIGRYRAAGGGWKRFLESVILSGSCSPLPNAAHPPQSPNEPNRNFFARRKPETTKRTQRHCLRLALAGNDQTNPTACRRPRPAGNHQTNPTLRLPAAMSYRTNPTIRAIAVT